MLEDEPNLEVILVPVGGGSGSAGACIVAQAINPAIQVFGVQAAAAPAAYEFWRTRLLAESPCQTFAEGLATGVGFAMTQQILWEGLHDFLLVWKDVEMPVEITYHEEFRALQEELADVLDWETAQYSTNETMIHI